MFQSIRTAGNKHCMLCFTSLLLISLVFVSFWNKEHVIKWPISGIYNSIISQRSGFLWKNETNFSFSNTNRIVCMIMTRVSNWETKGKAVCNTWAQRCHKALFFYTKVDNCLSHSICNETNAIGLNVPDGRGHLTGKTFGALNYSYNKYASEADYFMKADDDTYVIMENLQKIISQFNSTPFLYLGRRIDNLLPNGYNSGGAGYVISRQAVQLMLRNGSSFPADCLKDGAIEDFEIGKCLSKFKIYPQDELDETGKLTFHSDNPFKVLQGDGITKYYFIDFSRIQFGNKEAPKSRGFMLSEWTATIHYVTPPEMYMYDFLLYRLRRSTVNERNSTSTR